MLGLFFNEAYIAMKKYDDGGDNGDNYEKKEKNDNGNDADGSGYYDPIFSPITTPWSHLGLAKEDHTTTVTDLRPQRTMYLSVGLYIYPINSIVKMCHKPLYEKIGVLDLCC